MKSVGGKCKGIFRGEGGSGVLGIQVESHVSQGYLGNVSLCAGPLFLYFYVCCSFLFFVITFLLLLRRGFESVSYFILKHSK